MAQEHFEKLVIWQRAMQLVEHVYSQTREFPADEKSGLAATLRRTATAIPAKIAEADVLDDPEKVVHALKHVRGMVHEMQTYAVICHRLGFLGYLRYKSFRRQLYKIDRALGIQADQLAAPPRAPLLKPRLAA